MENFLPNGAVLPHGLLSESSKTMLEGFAKSYQNFALRVGIVVASYPASDPQNHSKLAMEYDVMAIEQNADRGATTILYRNCLTSEGMGSIADFFERTLRPKKKQTKKGDATDLKGQDGAIVLLLCLDGMSDKGIVLGQLTHPDRKTTLANSDPRMEGEYNGVNIKVEKDGSCKLTFRGATDSQGKPIDSSQGMTTIDIEKDGTFQVKHDKISLRMDRTTGTAAVIAKTDIELTADANVKLTAKKDIQVTADANVNITAKKNVTVKCVDINVTASGNLMAKCKEATIEASGSATVEGKSIKLGKGASEAVIKGDAFKTYFDTLSVATILGPSGPPIVPMPPTTLSKKVKTE